MPYALYNINIYIIYNYIYYMYMYISYELARPRPKRSVLDFGSLLEALKADARLELQGKDVDARLALHLSMTLRVTKERSNRSSKELCLNGFRRRGAPC